MRWLIWYIKSCFCSHDFKYESTQFERTDANRAFEIGTVVSATCSKCGYHKSYKKYKL